MLVVEVAFDGLPPRARADDAGVAELVDGDGVPRAVYRDLAAIDADGRDLLAHLELTSSSAELVVDDADAAYPIVIDPLVATLEAELPPPDKGLRLPDVAVSLDGDTALVASNVEVVTAIGGGGHMIGPPQGKGFVYTRSGTTWTLQQELDVPGPVDEDLSISASLSGDTAIVGESSTKVGTNQDQGAIYVFSRNGSTWGQPQTIEDSAGMMYDGFGAAVSVSGDTAFVNAGATTAIYGQSGGTWTRQQSFPWQTAALFVSGDTAVTARFAPVHVLVRNGASWAEQQQLQAPAGSKGFGRSVSVSGDTIVVGDDRDNDYHGAAYVFVRSGTTWTLEERLAPSDGHGFGTSVSVDGDTLVVGANGAGSYDDCLDAPACHPGVVHIFLRRGSKWTEQTPFPTPNGNVADQFGSAVSLSGRGVLVGNFDEGTSSRAYVLRLSGFEGDACTDDCSCASNACVHGTCQASAMPSMCSTSSSSSGGSGGSGGSAGTGGSGPGGGTGTGGSVAGGGCGCSAAGATTTPIGGSAFLLGVALAMRRRWRSSIQRSGAGRTQ
jgi:hypothetical protein